MLQQDLDKAADNRICIGNLAVIRERSIAGLEWLRRVIRVVGIIEMQPDEERPLLVPLQPMKRPIGDLLGPPLHALVAIFSRLAGVKIGVIEIESSVKTGGCSGPG